MSSATSVEGVGNSSRQATGGAWGAPSALALRRWCARHANVALIDLHLREADEPLRLLCECGERSCTEWLAVRDDEFDDVRSQTGLYIVATGHVGADLRPVRWADDHAVAAAG